MKVKELSHWPELFGLPPAPWLKQDWPTVLTIASRFLYSSLAERKGNSDSSEEHNSNPLCISFQELMQMAEAGIGCPQIAVVVDTKQGAAESQLSAFVTLCALKYSTNACDSAAMKAFGELRLPFSITFDMDVDEGSRYCAGCNTHAALVERCMVDGQVWHRRCLRCVVCKRQLYRGAFHGDPAHLECVDHFASRILHVDLHQKKMSPKSDDHHSHHQHNAPPPPRPPPPKLPAPSPASTTAAAAAVDEDAAARMTISQEIAAAVNHHQGSASPEKKRGNGSPSKNSPEASEKNWELLSYPVELNPFGSDEEAEGDEEGEEVEIQSSEIDFGTEGTKSTSNLNPFSDESDIEEVENLLDRVASCGGSNRADSAMCSPVASLSSVDGNKRASVAMIKPNGGEPAAAETEPSAVPKALSYLMKSSESLAAEKKYYAPLAPMINRTKGEDTSAWLNQASPQDLQNQLRKLHCQLTQIETTGKRLEVQLLRSITGGALDWKKSKLVEEYVLAIERKCEALRIESLLVRRYMDWFLKVTHEELEEQMRAVKTGPHLDELQELLAETLHMKNELLAIEVPAVKPPLPGTDGDANKSLKKAEHSLLKKGVKQTLKNLKKKL